VFILQVHGTVEKAEEARYPPCWSQLWGFVKDTGKNLWLWFFVVVGILWGLGFFSLYTWLPVVVQNMLSGTALVNSTSSGLRPGSDGRTPTKAILLTGIPSLTAAVAMVAVAWHSDRVNEKALHVAAPYLLGGLFLLCYTPMASLSFAAGFVNLVIAMTAANAATGVISSRVVGERLRTSFYLQRGTASALQ
jgi:MFS family permease